MSEHAGGRLAWLLCMVCGLCVAAAFALSLYNGTPFVEGYLAATMLVGVAFPALGALIVSRQPRNALGWVFCALGLSQALSPLATSYGTFALVTQPGSLPFGSAMSWVATWVWAPGLGLLMTFSLLLFPDGQLPSGRWRPIAWLAAAAIVSLTVLIAAFAWPLRGLALVTDTGNAPAYQVGMVATVTEAGFLLLAVTAFACVASLIWRFRQARGEVRQQLKWITYGGALFVVAMLVDSLLTKFSGWFGTLASPAIPAAAAVAIFKYHLFDIDVIIRRTLVYSVLTSALALVYFGSVAVLQSAVGTVGGRQSSVAIVASTLAIAALFAPLRRRVQNLIDRRFFRRRYDAAHILADFAAAARDETDLDLLSERLVSVVRETMQPEQASLWLRPATATRPLAGPARNR